MAPTVAASSAPASIDWDRPWLAHLSALRRVFDNSDARADLTRIACVRGVVSGQGASLSFVDAGDAGDTAYELHVARTGRVPTRTNLHDLFNAAVWLTLPRLKAVLNARQAQGFGADAADRRARRGHERDAATLFDESGLIVALTARAARESDVHARIVAHHWAHLFLEQRSRWHRDWVPWLVGHAVMEKLVQPYAAVTVRACVVVMGHDDPHDVAAVDAAAAAAFARDGAWSPSMLPPMPVLGIPGWWSANESPRFYEDESVFRPRRVASTAERDI